MITRRKILEGAPSALSLEIGNGYCYFVFDDPARNVFETHSVYTARLNHLPLSAWLAEREAFLSHVRGEIA